jgi:hypothetical protein
MRHSTTAESTVMGAEARSEHGSHAFGPDQMREVLARLEEPFDASAIKWRVTNTSKVNGRSGAHYRGQMLAYADPRAYTDRLNSVFGPSGWTREYDVKMVQNFERKDRGTTERTITAKIVVTCCLTIYGLGRHAGLGEEWADNENAGTVAEAQAFKRACSCFGLGRYLYDLEGQWVDLDERKRPLEKPRLPEWALARVAPLERGGPNTGSSSTKNGKSGLYHKELLAQVLALSQTVGSGLAKSVLRTVAKVDNVRAIRNVARLTQAMAVLQDTARGVERLGAAIRIVGEDRYSAMCRDLNLAGGSLNDIPDRPVLRRLVEALEAEAARASDHASNACGANDGGTTPDASEMRDRLLREARELAGLTKRTLGSVIREVGKGAFTFASLRSVSASDSANLSAALEELAGLKKSFEQAGVSG